MLFWFFDLIFAWPALIVWVLALTFLAHMDLEGIVVGALILLSVAYMYHTHVPLINAGYALLAYIAIGFLWSAFRYWRHVRTRKADLESHYLSRHGSSKTDLIEASVNADLQTVRPSEMTGSIVAWMLAWPFSGLALVGSDVIDGIQFFVKRVLKGVYNRIFEAVAGS
jgi:hypothetical protein